MSLTLTACTDDDDNDSSNNDTQSEANVNRQLEDGVTISPGAVREGDGWNHERFEGESSGGVGVIDEGDDEIIIMDEQVFVIDENSDNEHRASRSDSVD
jgi:hypothetical protein